MKKVLIITEKPKIAKQLLQSPRFRNSVKKQGSKPYYGYIENDRFIITWANGHLYEVMNPGEQDEKYKPFSFEHLPIILPVKYKVVNGFKEQVKIINKLIDRPDVEEIWNACDTDKEGELIFREIYEQAKCQKPVFRVWTSSYTAGDVEAALNGITKGEKYDSFADSARVRQYLDHLIGDTITRSATVKMANNHFLLSGGRVQICLLHEIHKRELEVENFKPQTFYNLIIDTGFSSLFKSEQEYVLNPSPLKEIGEKLKGNDIYVKAFEKKESTRNAPNLFNATDFLKAAIQKLSITAPQAKKVLQKLYEDGYVSYPRTDSRHLPSSMIDSVKDILTTTGNSKAYDSVMEHVKIEKVSAKNKCFDDEKVSSHYAIIPTDKPFNPASDLEGKVYDLIMKRFLANFMDSAKFDVCEIVLEDRDGHEFVAKEKILKRPGFLEIEREILAEEEISKNSSFPELSPGEIIRVNDYEIRSGQTRKPGFHTETSMLSFMETAGRNLVEDEEIKELLKGKRIGTPATVESFVPKLIERGYVGLEKDKLRTTQLGAAFISAFPIEELKDPTFTATMEENIKKVEEKKLSYAEFIEQINSFSHVIVKQMSELPATTVQIVEQAHQNDVTLCSCTCGKGMIVDKGKFFGCSNYPECEVRVPKEIKGKVIPSKQLARLIEKGETDVIKGFKDGEDQSFEAIIFFSDGKLKFKKAVFGTCPVCKKGEIKKNQSKTGKEFFGCSAYKDGCEFSVPGIIKSKKLPEGQIKKLLQHGSTDFIDGFIGKNDTEFTARIALDNGKVQMLVPTKEDKTIGKCPLCGGSVLTGKSYYLCEQYKKTCEFILSPVYGKKKIPGGQIVKLLEKNITDTIKGFENKDGSKTFDAKLSYDVEQKRLVYVFEKKQGKQTGGNVKFNFKK